MRTLTTEYLVSIVSQLRAQGHPVAIVGPGSYKKEDWTMYSVSLADSAINPKAREVALILKTHLEEQGYVVKELIKADGIWNFPRVPWKELGQVLGTLVLVCAAIWGLIQILPYLLAAAALVMVVGLADPVLIAVIRDGEEEVWVRCGWWLDFFGK